MWVNPVVSVCEQCGKDFHPSSGGAAGRAQRFCSLQCFGVTKRTEPASRFWKQVIRAGDDECWLWTGRRHETGHGMFYVSRSLRTTGAHRFSWILANGPVPDGLWVLHNCPGGDNPACVNPRHLWLGTNTDNMRDASAKGQLATGDRSGARLHPERHARGDQHWTRANPTKLRRGAENPASKLTPEAVLAIRASSRSQTALAREYGVSQAVVSAVIRRKTWKHV